MPRKYITYLSASIISLTLAINQPTKTAAKLLEDIASFSIDSAKVTLHEPVLINFVVKNTQSETIKFDLGADRKESFRVTLTLPDGTRTKPRQQVISGFARGGEVTIPPGQIFTQQVLINEWFEFPVPGVYIVKVEMITPILSQRGQVITGSASRTFSIQVLPRDPKALEEICKNLLDQVITSTSYAQAAERATILSFINDPVAVPYLERVSKGGRKLELKAVKGLARINSLEAIEALINLLTFHDPDVVAAAHSSLSKIELETKDQAIKERINRALKSR
ncbi:MAG TPA: HEAT repeat domain-containing protein [Pyrinomonadaceae bacterium]|jgi:HEAT repeats